MPSRHPVSRDLWQDLANRWNRLGPPLRPSPEDIKTVHQALGRTPGPSLLLGVTPELSALNSRIIALDNSAGMIGALWPENRENHPAVQGDWRDMPFADNSFTTAIADGSFTLLDYPRQYQQVFAHLQRVIRPGGQLIVRVFASPETGETCETVCNEAMAGNINGFHAFKWRLSMAITSETGDPNLQVADTLAAFNRLLPDREQLARASGWDMEDIATIDFYQGTAARYSYPTLTQFRRIIPACFRETGLARGSYELAERCPTLLLEHAP